MAIAGNHMVYSDDKVEHVLHAYQHEPGRSVKEIATEFGVTTRVINRWVKNRGIQPRRPGRIPLQTRETQMYMVMRREALSLYRKNRTKAEIAKILECNQNIVYKMLENVKPPKVKVVPKGRRSKKLPAKKGWRPEGVTEEKWAEFKRRHQTREPLKNIAESFGIEKYTASRWALKGGLPMKPPTRKGDAK